MKVMQRLANRLDLELSFTCCVVGLTYVCLIFFLV